MSIILIQSIIRNAINDNDANELAKSFLLELLKCEPYRYYPTPRSNYLTPPMDSDIKVYLNQEKYITERISSFVNLKGLQFKDETINKASVILFNNDFLKVTNYWCSTNFFQINIEKLIEFKTKENKDFSKEIKHFTERELEFFLTEFNTEQIEILDPKQNIKSFTDFAVTSERSNLSTNLLK